MDEEAKKVKISKKAWFVILIIVAAFVAASVVGFLFGDDKKQDTAQNRPASKVDSSQTQTDSLISYDLPSGWSKISCSDPTEVVLIVPAGKVSPDCKALSDSWPMKILVDSASITDCSQIKVNNQQITNHVCSSQTINGKTIFVSSTTYNNKSQYGRNTKVSDYYIKTSNKVLKLEYADDLTMGEDDYQTQFDQIANSIRVK